MILDTTKMGLLMDKMKLIDHIRIQLEKDLKVLKEAARATYEAATHEESKPENEYDTRGLEASYLAGAQAQRVAEIEHQLSIYKHLQIRNYGPKDPISSTALVEVEFNDKRSFIFVMPKGGGLALKYDGELVQVITPHSPLGSALLGLKAGDVALVEAGQQTREYEVLSVQ